MEARVGEPCPLAAVLACAEDAVGDPNGEVEVEMRLATLVGRWPYENNKAWASLSCEKVCGCDLMVGTGNGQITSHALP